MYLKYLLHEERQPICEYELEFGDIFNLIIDVNY